MPQLGVWGIISKYLFTKNKTMKKKKLEQIYTSCFYPANSKVSSH